MNLFTRLTIIGGLLLAPALFAADGFEGKVSMTMTGNKGDAHAMTYMMKGTMMRLDMEAGKGSMIMDLEKHQMIMLMHERQMYMIMKMPQPQDQGPHQAGTPGGPPSDRTPPDVTATGKTQEILGYTCSQFLVKDGDKTTELWLAPGLGVFMGLHAGSSPFGGRSRNAEAAAKWEEAFKGKAGFPLRVITRDGSGKETNRMDVTKIEKGGVSDGDFAPPAGYQQFQMPNIPGFGGG